MKTWKEFLAESPVAGYGDYKPLKPMIATKGYSALLAAWKRVGELRTKNREIYDVWQHTKTNQFIVGSVISNTDNENPQFFIVGRIKLKPMNSISATFSYKNVFNVDLVQTKPDMMGDGIATALYMFLVDKMNYTILGDSIQYFGARKLWSRLSKRNDLVVDVLDIDNDVVVAINATIEHGLQDHEFDPKYYSYENSKANIRLVLKNLGRS